MSSNFSDKAKHVRGGEKGKKRALLTLAGLFVVVLIVCASVIAVWLQDLPSIDKSDKFNYSQKTKVYANDGTTLLAEFYLEDREPVDLDSISPYVITGTIATEDERFFAHNGVDLFGIARAFFANMGGSRLEGASTITQQFIRNTYLIDEANNITLKRKVREAALALDLESRYSKDQILLMYLNTINYGDGCYGIESASQHYFQKHASELTATEAATLIGIPQSPTYNNPVYYPDNCLERRNIVLDRMVAHGVISQEEYKTCRTSPLALNLEEKSRGDGIVAFPYFTSYVRQLLLDTYSTAQVFESGLTVYTTIDPTMQAAAEAAAQEQYALMAEDIEVSLTAIDPSTGYIKAMVGGKDYYADQFNLATQSKRQAGSSFKTFTLAAAIEQGISPQTYIDCTSPVTLNGWRVENYDGGSYGIKTIQDATAISSNTGFARLIQTVTPKAAADIAHRMGITSNLEEVASITLGSQGVCTLEMADAYATLANGGIHNDAVAITKVVNRDGDTIFEHQGTPTRALSSEVAYATTKVLQTVFTGGTATAARLSSGQVAAGKTGTSENWRDSWLCGYTPQLSCAVWIGARAERQMPAWIDCSRVWRSFMTAALAGQPLQEFATAANPAYNNKFNQEQLDYFNKKKEEEEAKKKEEEAKKFSPANAPNVVGMTLEQATKALAGFKAEYVQEYSSTIKTGLIIKQEVVNDVVRLHVSLGPKPVTPDPTTPPVTPPTSTP